MELICGKKQTGNDYRKYVSNLKKLRDSLTKVGFETKYNGNKITSFRWSP
jgi:hypothetical protein